MLCHILSLVATINWTVKLCLFSEGLLNDLHMYDISKFMWVDLSRNVSGPAPSPRQSHGFISCNDKLYVFGGWNGEGTKVFRIRSHLLLTCLFFILFWYWKICHSWFNGPIYLGSSYYDLERHFEPCHWGKAKSQRQPWECIDWHEDLYIWRVFQKRCWISGFDASG